LKKFAVLTVFSAISTFFFLSNPSYASTNTIKSLKKQIILGVDGDAKVEETWSVSAKSGTEIYQAFSDLRGKEITDFTVRDDSGRFFTNVGTWNTGWSFNQKSYKNGYNYTPDGLELCFGLSEYGNRTFIVNYTITGLVTQYSDAQVVYFDFLNMDMAVNNAVIEIKLADGTPLSTDNARIWAFGYSGDVLFSDNGSVTMTPSNNGFLGENEHMQLLLGFTKDLFQDLKNSDSRTFIELFEYATEESEYAKQKPNSSFSASNYGLSGNENLFLLMALMVPFAPIVIMFLLILGVSSLNRKTRSLFARTKGKTFQGGSRLPNEYTIQPYKEIPCHGQIALAYYLMNTYGIGSEAERKKGLLGAVLLSYAREKKVSFYLESKQYWLKNKEEYVINLNRLAEEPVGYGSLADILIKAAGGNRILEKSELKTYCRRSYSELENWFDSVCNQGSNLAREYGLLGYDEKSSKQLITLNARDEAIKLIGLKNYLLQFSTITRDIGVQEVVIWEEYLIFATLLGISEQVEEQLKIHYPEIVQNMNFGDTRFNQLDVLDEILSFGSISYSAMLSGISKASASAAMSSIGSFSGGGGYGGGGGSSSFSGGGSSGGSSGGGIR